MSLRPDDEFLIPAETARVAHAAFPKGNWLMTLRDELGVIYRDSDFARLFSPTGQPAESPGRLALVTVVQFAEGLTDREAADAVRSRIDLKYLLGLPLENAGFDFSVLSEFRERLQSDDAAQRLLTDLLARFKAKGVLKARQKQRTDSTHVLDVVRALNRLELVGETLRAALNLLAGSIPHWLRAHVSVEWFERYGERFMATRLPKTEPERQAVVLAIGQDGWNLFIALWQDPTCIALRDAPAIEMLRQVWLQNYAWVDEQLQWRAQDNLPPSARMIQSPYDVETHYSTKRETEWVGYKVHLTETCEADTPHLITNVETTPANRRDHEVMNPIHQKLASQDLLPDDHLVDAGYTDADVLVTSETEFHVQVIGRVAPDPSWQAQAGQGFAVPDFQVDWNQQTVLCPQNHASRYWSLWKRAEGEPAILVRFAEETCRACPVHLSCTHSAQGARTLKLLPRPQFEALQAARQRQETPEFKTQYKKRAGVEGTISQGVRAFELRRARYVGLAKIKVQHLATAAAMNLRRYAAWLEDTITPRPRSPFAALAPAVVKV
jgi:transposase